MKKNANLSDDSRQFLFYFLYGEGIKIDQNLNAEERKKYVKKRIRKTWIYNGLFFLVIMLFSGIQFLQERQPYFIMLLIFAASIVIVLSLIDCIKLLIKNRKIDKMQRSMSVMHNNDVPDRNSVEKNMTEEPQK